MRKDSKEAMMLTLASVLIATLDSTADSDDMSYLADFFTREMPVSSSDGECSLDDLLGTLHEAVVHAAESIAAHAGITGSLVPPAIRLFLEKQGDTDDR